ncbi:class I SAM-dependent methyltransferase, partial [Candidatus Latescibacterota bacterium]
MKKKLYGRFRISRNFLNPQKNDTILSIGCKEAELESYIIDEVKSITAIDINCIIIEENIGKYPNITFEYGDIIRGTDYPDESFDKILFLEVLEHLPDNTEEKALKENFRLLKTGGTMVISTPNDTPVAAIMDPAHWLINHRHYKPDKVKTMLDKAGFTVESEYIGGGIIEMVWIPVFYLLLRLKLAG